VCKKLIKNSQPFGKNFQKTLGGIFLTHTVHTHIYCLMPCLRKLAKLGTIEFGVVMRWHKAR